MKPITFFKDGFWLRVHRVVGIAVFWNCVTDDDVARRRSGIHFQLFKRRLELVVSELI